MAKTNTNFIKVTSNLKDMTIKDMAIKKMTIKEKHKIIETKIIDLIASKVIQVIHDETMEKKPPANWLEKLEKLTRANIKDVWKLFKRHRKKFAKEDIACIKWSIKHCWHKHMGRLNIADQGKFRWYLIMFAEIMIGKDQALTIPLYFRRYRKLVVKHQKVIEIGLDSALNILNHIRFKTGYNNMRKSSDLLIRFLIELLWQGIPLQDAVEMCAGNFDPEKNIIFINTGAAYRLSSADKEFWARSYGLLKKIPRWYRSHRHARPETIEKYFIGRVVYHNVNLLLKKTAEELGIPKDKVNQGNFRQAGIAYKILVENLPPACLSSFFGPELPTNVLGLEYIYGDKNFRKKKKSVKP